MDTTKHRVKGAAEQVTGRVKETVGAATADRDLQAEGRGQQATGNLREKGAKAVARGQSKLNRAIGKAEAEIDHERARSDIDVEGVSRRRGR